MLKSLLNHRHAFKIYAGLAFLYIVAPTITFFHDVLGYNLTFGVFEPSPENFEIVNLVERTQFSVLTVLIAIVWARAFYIESKNKTYKIHAKAGMVGVFFSLVSLSLISFLQWKLLVFIFGFSGFLCIYCTSVPMYSWVVKRFKQKQWESFFIATTLGGGTYYLLSGYAEIMLNELFTINASYFSYTLPIAKFLLVTPILALGSILTLFIVLRKENKTKDVTEQTFYNFNTMMVCFTLVVLCSALGSRSREALELVATKFDFDSKSPCSFEESYDGYIVLDPAHNKVLTYSKGSKTPYVVKGCALKK